MYEIKKDKQKSGGKVRWAPFFNQLEIGDSFHVPTYHEIYRVASAFNVWRKADPKRSQLMLTREKDGRGGATFWLLT